MVDFLWPSPVGPNVWISFKNNKNTHKVSVSVGIPVGNIDISVPLQFTVDGAEHRQLLGQAMALLKMIRKIDNNIAVRWQGLAISFQTWSLVAPGIFKRPQCKYLRSSDCKWETKALQFMHTSLIPNGNTHALFVTAKQTWDGFFLSSLSLKKYLKYPTRYTNV